MIRRLRPLVVVLLLAAGICTGAIVAPHNHAGPDFKPNCPGCHQERTIGSSSGSLAVQAVVFALVPVGPAPVPRVESVPDTLAAFDSPPRSPPASV